MLYFDCVFYDRQICDSFRESWLDDILLETFSFAL